jgi:hypothetical protein
MSSHQIQSPDAVKLITQPIIFDLMINDDSDIIGLLAYALHELSHREWHKGFVTHFSREPNVDEKNAFMIGEGTSHRISVYRRMAEDALNRQQLEQPEIKLNDLAASHEILPLKLAIETPVITQTIIESKWARGTKAALRLPADTNLKTLGKALALLFVIVSLLAIIVNYAKHAFF